RSALLEFPRHPRERPHTGPGVILLVMQPKRLLNGRKAATLAVLSPVIAVLALVAGCHSSQQSAPSAQSSAVPPPPPVEMPFSALEIPKGAAGHPAGAVYVVDNSNRRVLKLPAGSDISVELPFSGLKDPLGVAVDTGGAVYVTDNSANRVLKLPAGS